MATGFKGVINRDGSLKTPEDIRDCTEDPGLAYETIEEMFGMIHHLAMIVGGDGRYEGSMSQDEIVNMAWENYEEGLESKS